MEDWTIGQSYGSGRVSRPFARLTHGTCRGEASCDERLHHSGSPYALHLGSLVRIARVQSEHLRLCLNSYALKAGADEDELIGKYLKKALNAALGTIQTHFESNQTDLALSFATDVSSISRTAC